MGVESLCTFRVQQNEHVEYKHAISLDMVTFKEEFVALHEATEIGTLNVLEGAEQVPVATLLEDMAGTEICIVEFNGDKVGYFIGTQDSGFYLGPEVDLEILRDTQPEAFEQIQQDGVPPSGAPQIQPQIQPSAPGLASPGGVQVNQNQQVPNQTQIQGQQQGQPNQTGLPGNMTMDDLMALINNAQANQGGNNQGGGNDQGGGDENPPS